MMKKTIACAVAAAAAAAYAYGPDSAKKGQLRVNAPLVVAEKDAETAAALGRALVSASRKDAGVVGYDMYRSVTMPGWFVFCETWKDQASLDAHSASPHFTGIVPELQKLGKMGVDAFTIGDDAPSGKVRLNCFKTAKPGAEGEGVIEKAKEMIAATWKNDEGVIEYDFLVSVTDPLEMMVYETWTDSASLEKHLAKDHLKRIAPEIRKRTSRSWMEKFVK